MRWVAPLVLSALVLSGCSGDSVDDDIFDPTSSTSASIGPGGEGTITVALDRTTIDGPAPLKVNFSLAATFQDSSGNPATRPGSPTITVAYRQTEDANGTALTESAQAGPTISTFPSTFSLTFENAGKYEVAASVKASGFREGKITMVITARAGGGNGTGAESIFFDGAEGDASQWNLTAKVVFIDFNGVVPTQETPADHPTGKWQISDAEAYAGTHSWFSSYPDNYRGRMVSLPIEVPGSGGKLSFWYKGGAESNGYDGMFVYVNDVAVMSALEGPFGKWTKASFNVPGGKVTLEFRMDSDPSCSNDPSPPAGCGTGFDSGGFYVDDITVA